uniref:Uncharacterized protein n=1 Tax=Knipowitschia caucasica TaxID=637954 RepID=A0AAV2ME53_KNICA
MASFASVTQLAYSSLVDRWDPLDPALGLEPLSVRRNTPCLWVLLSTVPLDRGMLGYQRPGHHCDLWGGVASEHKPGSRKRRGGGARAHRENRPQIS